jgi:hypothetical protein
MKGLLLDSKGDLVIKNHDIALTDGDNLVAQTVKMVLSTNKGEWSLNHEEGINFRNILGKAPVTSMANNAQGYEEDLIKSEILQGLSQVDDTFFMTSCVTDIQKDTRTAHINFTAETDSGQQISEVITYA